VTRSLLAFLLALLPSVAAAQPLRLADLDGRLIDPFQAPEGTRAVVFLFTSVECPISNRYAPVVSRLHAAFSSRRVQFRLVYPNPADTPAAIRAHLAAYGYPMSALRDPDRRLAALASVSVTPEAAIFDTGGRELYHGRIDDRYVSIGVERPSPTRHDLADALDAVLAGNAVAAAATPAVGCFIADFVP
jgi:hypothetical protein